MKERLTKRQQQAIETRKRILSCALQLFEEKDFDNVSIGEIAEAAQVSVGSIYHYFKGKEEIAAQGTEPLDDVYQDFYEQLMESEEYSGYSSLKKLEVYYVFVQKTVSAYGNLRSVYIHNLRYPDSESLAINERRGLYQNYHDLLLECRKEGVLTDQLTDEEIIELLIQSSRGMIVDWFIRKRVFDFGKQAERWFHIILQAIEVKREPPR